MLAGWLTPEITAILFNLGFVDSKENKRVGS